MDNLNQAIKKAKSYDRRQYKLQDPSGQLLINAPAGNKANKTLFFKKLAEYEAKEMLPAGQYAIICQNSMADQHKVKVPFQYGEANQMLRPRDMANLEFSTEQQAQILELTKQNTALDLEKQHLQKQLEVYQEKYQEALNDIEALEKELDQAGALGDESEEKDDLPAWLKPLMPSLVQMGTNFLMGLAGNASNMQGPVSDMKGDQAPKPDQQEEDEPGQDFHFDFNQQWANPHN